MKAYIYSAKRKDWNEIGTLVAPTRTHAMRRLRKREYESITVREILEPTTTNLYLYDV